MRYFIFIGMMVVFVVSSGCAGRLVYRNEGLKNTVVVNPLRGSKKHFLQEETNHFYVWGLFSSDPPLLAQALKKQVGPNQRVSNLMLREKRKPEQFLFCLITAVIYCPYTLEIEGDIH
ncbi:MAG: hypothetical protein AAB309_02670 [Deltaproteobacteria bacterium]